MTRAPGFALVGALLALVVAAIFGGTMAELARTELLVARNGTRLASGLVALDECASIVTRTLPLGWEFGDVLAGPDATPGTADDGTLPAPPWCRAAARPLAGPTPRILLDLEATRGGGRRRGGAVVGRARTPGPPALLWLDAGTNTGRVLGSVTLDGGVAGASAWAAAASPDDPGVLDAWIASAGGRIDVRPPTTASSWSPGPPLAAIADVARSAGAASPAVGIAPSSPAPALCTLVEGDLAVADARWARGALIVTGRLRVAPGGALTVDGLLVALGGVDVVFGAALEVRGAVWSGTPLAGAVDVTGRLHVAAAPAALERAAMTLTLPHEPRLLGWIDR